MNQDFIRGLLDARGIQVSDEHLAMLEAQAAAIDAMRKALTDAPGADSDLGLVHALKELAHD